MKNIVVTLVVCLAQASTVFSQPKVAGEEKFQIKGFTGENLLTVFAATCSEKNWVPFAKWARKSGLAKISNNEKIDLQVNTLNKSVSLPGKGIEVKATPAGHFQLLVGGKTFEGEDSCQLMTNISKTSPRSSALRLLLPYAFAGQLFSEDTSEANKNEWEGLGIAFVGFATIIASSGTLSAVGILPLTFGLFAFDKSSQELHALKDFEEVLNEPLKFTCIAGVMTVHAAGQRSVIVTHPPAMTSIQMKHGNETIHSDQESAVAIQSSKMLINLANKCQSPDDAVALTKLFADAQQIVQQRLVAFNADAAIPGATAPVPKVN